MNATCLYLHLWQKKKYNTRKNYRHLFEKRNQFSCYPLEFTSKDLHLGMFCRLIFWTYNIHTPNIHQQVLPDIFTSSKKIRKLNLLAMGFWTHKYQKAWVYIPALFRSSCVTRADLYEPFELKSPTPNRHHPSSITTYVTRPVYFSICCSNSSTLAATPLRPQCFTILKQQTFHQYLAHYKASNRILNNKATQV